MLEPTICFEFDGTAAEAEVKYKRELKTMLPDTAWIVFEEQFAPELDPTRNMAADVYAHDEATEKQALEVTLEILKDRNPLVIV